MPHPDLITIAIPAYERRDYLKEALESALNQTVFCSVIVVDNASSHSWFEELCQQLPEYATGRLKYFRNPSNLGLFGNWNRCAELSMTPFFMVLCDDDILKPSFVEEFVSAYEANPAMELYYTQFERFGASFVSHPVQDIDFGTFRGELSWKSASRSGLSWPTNSTVYLTQLVKDHPWRNPSPKRHSNADWLLCYRLAEGRVCVGNPRPLYLLRSHPVNAGKASETYVLISRSEVFHEIAMGLRNLGDVDHSELSFKRSAESVTNSYLSDPVAFRKMVADCVRDGDPFVEFVNRFWTTRSHPIRVIMNPSASWLELRFAWILLRFWRLMSRCWKIPYYRYITGGSGLDSPEQNRCSISSK